MAFIKNPKNTFKFNLPYFLLKSNETRLLTCYIPTYKLFITLVIFFIQIIAVEDYIKTKILNITRKLPRGKNVKDTLKWNLQFFGVFQAQVNIQPVIVARACLLSP